MSLLLIPTITPMPAHPLWYCANDKGKSNACIYKYYNDGTEPEMQKCYDDNLRTTYWMKKCYPERDECIRDCSMTACTGVDAICKGDTAKNFWDGVHKVWCYGTKDCTTPTPICEMPVIYDTFDVRFYDEGVVNKFSIETSLGKYENWFEYDKEANFVIPKGGETLVFQYKIKPNGVPKGTYEFDVIFRGDGRELMRKPVTIELKCDSNPLETPTPSKKICIEEKKTGDYNGDGNIDGLDYTWWKQEFVDKIQHEGKWEATPDCSDKVTSLGYSVWRYNYLR